MRFHIIFNNSQSATTKDGPSPDMKDAGVVHGEVWGVLKAPKEVREEYGVEGGNVAGGGLGGGDGDGGGRGKVTLSLSLSCSCRGYDDNLSEGLIKIGKKG